MLPVFAKHSIDILTPGVRVDHGTEVPDWSNPTSVTVAGCSVQPTFGEEETQHRDAVQSEYTAYLPPGTAVTAQSRVRWNDELYEVVGRPSVWSIGMGAVDHVAVHMNRWDG